MAEHAVLVKLKLSADEFGTGDEIQSIQELAEQLDVAIIDADVGEFDGDEFGEGECTLYTYGPNADALFSTIEPILRSSRHAPGGYVIKRYGEASDPSAIEVRIDL